MQDETDDKHRRHWTFPMLRFAIAGAWLDMSSCLIVRTSGLAFDTIFARIRRRVPAMVIVLTIRCSEIVIAFLAGVYGFANSALTK